MTTYTTLPTETYGPYNGVTQTTDKMEITSDFLHAEIEDLKAAWHGADWEAYSNDGSRKEITEIENKLQFLINKYRDSLTELPSIECQRCNPKDITIGDIIDNCGAQIRVTSIKVVTKGEERPIYCIHGDYAGGDLERYRWSVGHILNGTARDYRSYTQGNDLAMWYKA